MRARDAQQDAQRREAEHALRNELFALRLRELLGQEPLTRRTELAAAIERVRRELAELTR